CTSCGNAHSEAGGNAGGNARGSACVYTTAGRRQPAASKVHALPLHGRQWPGCASGPCVGQRHQVGATALRWSTCSGCASAASGPSSGANIWLQPLGCVDDLSAAAFANSIGLLWHSDSGAATHCNPARGACVAADKHPVEKLGGKAHFCFTPVISDGQSQGCKAMRYSLISREVITDCIELMHEGYHADAIITLAGCDKSVPASVMPLARK
ncbi:ilvD, partial [Symbiodinium necroappetens]